MLRFSYSAVLIPDFEAGGYSVEVPALPGVVTQGDTREQALANAEEAARLMIQDMLADGEDVPLQSGSVEVASIDIDLEMDSRTTLEEMAEAAQHLA